MRLDLNQCTPPYEGGALPLSYASVDISFRQYSQRPVTQMAFPDWRAALRALFFKSNTNTFRPGSRNPRDGLFANTDEMKRDANHEIASRTLRLVQFNNAPTHDTKLLKNVRFCRFDDLKSKKPGSVA